ncbi:molybdenum cofactor biosynthesis F family protein [Saccharothrix variisporea]|uniref:Molybdenum cofactor biosynthesis protein F n=1 Tax=Saccharothrix variisporea TaxID=543527 RepID=A0A495X5Y0_9PSEU|nr:molybdenum cofactor biosynthesis F family protein [Saccharothrix variisporea]RKT68053.1 molybdenum cofactor biosynthesis protein F [Saccharothrix variisporea]
MSEEWKTVDDFAAGIDGNRLPRSNALAGLTWTVRHDDGGGVRLSFVDDSRLASGDSYEAVEGAPGTFFVSRTFRDEPRRAEVVIADVNTLRTLTVESTIGVEATPGVPQVSQRFRAGVLEGGEPSGQPPVETRDLIGWRALYRYSPNHLYEHVYLSSERYAWQCLVGEQRGHGDVDLATAWKVGENRYVFTFREFRIPVATTWLYDLDAMRTTGVFFGLNGQGEVRLAPGGAHIISLGRVTYPGDDQPV